jgi:hypothetical protein
VRGLGPSSLWLQSSWALLGSVVRMMSCTAGKPTNPSSVKLFWLPLGAGDHCVRWSGRSYEALVSRHEGRPARDLYHSALEVQLGDDRYVIESAPAWGGEAPHRGVVCEGPVGLSWLGRSRFFRYEVRCWCNGVIPDVSWAVGSPVDLSTTAARSARLLRLAPSFPTLTWGRDELRTGDMWNSNSLIAWLLVRSGHDASALTPPGNGRAPGWSAGLVVAARQRMSHDGEPGPP